MKNDIDWYDWKCQLKNRITSVNELKKLSNISFEQISWLEQNFELNSFPFSVTPYFASLMENSLNCPIFKQVIPSLLEKNFSDLDFKDPLGEKVRQKTSNLVHRYPDRVLFWVTDRCFSYCRFCTRKRFVGQGPTPKKNDYEDSFNYIKNNPHIKEIIFSGGDPLIVKDEIIEQVISKSFSISHIENIRFHSRVLSFLPMRITEELCFIFSKYSPIYLVTHFNHPKEITSEAVKAINLLIKSGVVILNQSVLLSGINDNEIILEDLFRKLIKNRIKPYYLHQCDLVEGASHFRVPIQKSLQLMDKLRGNLSGICLPTLIIDIPGGFGKVPICTNYVVDENLNYIYLKGFKGEINKYPKN